MNYKDLDKHLESGIKNVYLIKGDEHYFALQSLEKLMDKLSLKTGDADLTTFNDENYSYNACVSVMLQFALIANKRMIVIRESCNMSESDKKSIKELLSQLDEFTVVAFVDLGKNNTFKVFESVAEVVECKKLTNFELVDIINADIKSYGKTITNVATKTLIELCQNDLMLIKNELIKLRFYPVEDITEEVVSLLTTNNLEYEVYELTNALGRKDADKSLSLVVDMLKNNNNPFGLISSYFRRMFFALISSATTQELTKIFKVKEFAIIKSKEQASKFGARKLKEINNLLLEVDYMIKSGAMLQENAIYYLIFNILQ